MTLRQAKAVDMHNRLVKTPGMKAWAGPLFLGALAACASTAGVDRPAKVDAAYAARESESAHDGDRCGPEFIEKALPAALVSWMEPALNGPFGPACRRHDACYRLSEKSQAWCDTRMLEEMVSICNAGRSESSPGAILCRSRARMYHAMVDSHFGAYAYQGTADGQILTVEFADAPAREVSICVGIVNTTQILQQYALELRTGSDQRIARVPRQHGASVRAGEQTNICIGTTSSTYWNANRTGTPVELRLMANRPDSLALAGDMVEIESRWIDLPASAEDQD